MYITYIPSIIPHIVEEYNIFYKFYSLPMMVRRNTGDSLCIFASTLICVLRCENLALNRENEKKSYLSNRGVHLKQIQENMIIHN